MIPEDYNPEAGEFEHFIIIIILAYFTSKEASIEFMVEHDLNIIYCTDVLHGNFHEY